MSEFEISTNLMVLIYSLVIWSSVWKAIALWKASRRGATAWYVVMWILNTAGILEILYIFVFSNKQKERCAKKSEQEK